MNSLFEKGATMVLKPKAKRGRRYPWYEVHDAQSGFTCGLMERLTGDVLRYWVAVHTGKSVFALGSFYCACDTKAAADQIAAALNRP